MRTAKEIWNDKELRCGGFYELAMEISNNNQSRKDTELFLKSIFEIEFVKGPFDNDFNKSEIYINDENTYGEVLGYLEVGQNQIPFTTILISEEVEKGSNWVDICFYTGIYEEILGKEYQTWATNGNWHLGFDKLLIKILTHLNSKHKIRLGIIGFEVSGMYSLESIKKEKLNKYDISHTKFFVNKEEEELKNGNWEKINQI